MTRTSNALDLEAGVFALDDPLEIARSLKRSAEASARRKSTPFRSAMSIADFLYKSHQIEPFRGTQGGLGEGEG